MYSYNKANIDYIKSYFADHNIAFPWDEMELPEKIVLDLYDISDEINDGGGDIARMADTIYRMNQFFLKVQELLKQLEDHIAKDVCNTDADKASQLRKASLLCQKDWQVVADSFIPLLQWYRSLNTKISEHRDDLKFWQNEINSVSKYFGTMLKVLDVLSYELNQINDYIGAARA